MKEEHAIFSNNGVPNASLTQTQWHKLTVSSTAGEDQWYFCWKKTEVLF